MNRTENKFYCSDCAILRAVRLRGEAVRGVAARWQSWCSTAQRCSSIISVSHCVAFSPLGSIHWWVLTKWTTKKGYLAAHYAVPWRRINEYDLCLIVTCATSLALYCFINGVWVYKGSINPVPREWMWRKERGRILIKSNKARICTTFWVTFEFSWGFWRHVAQLRKQNHSEWPNDFHRVN